MSNRIKFFLGHLTISILIALLLLSIIFFIWYPYPLAKAVNAIDIFLIALCVDLIIGPVLGLIVYKQGKKSLKFDLSVIILVQIIALAGGVYSIFQGRSVWIVYDGNSRFDLVRNNEIYTAELWKAQPEYQYPSLLKPQFVAVRVAATEAERSQEMFDEVFGGIPSTHRPEKYVAINNSIVQKKMVEHAQAIQNLKKYNNAHQVQMLLAKYPEANGWLPLKSDISMVVLINKKTAEVVDIVDLRPWKE